MLVVKDAMVLIHLAKTSLLDAAVDYFQQVSIPSGVHEETVVAGKKHDYPDAEVIAELIDTGRIEVASDIESSLVERANRYNIQGGEAEAVALYWQRDAELLATDDDNVRRKRTVLELDLIGTPAILLELYETARIDASKATATIDEFRSIGWFSTALLDTVELEAGLT
jgi:predicted nucleic acid-binding protein